MEERDDRRRLMMEALAEARKGRGGTFPNPAVGAVVVRGGRIVGRGYHKRWGKPHAEVEAIRDAGPRARGADLYVTLEPCSHWGRTPPCTDAVIETGIRRVIVPTVDPNPLVRGRGLRALRRGGVEVTTGVCAREARRINEAYFKFMRTGHPFVTLKLAQTLDGRIATLAGEAKWVTSAPARRLARRMRGDAQAVLVGVNTVKHDDPELLPTPRRKFFYRCILDTNLSIPLGSKVVRTARRHPTMVFCRQHQSSRVRRLEARGVHVCAVGKGAAGLLNPESVIHTLAGLGVMHVFIEGGGAVSSCFLAAGLVDKMMVFTAPKVLGDVNGLGAFSRLDVKRLADCYAFRLEETGRVGPDLYMILYSEKRRGGG